MYIFSCNILTEMCARRDVQAVERLTGVKWAKISYIITLLSIVSHVSREEWDEDLWIT